MSHTSAKSPGLEKAVRSKNQIFLPLAIACSILFASAVLFVYFARNLMQTLAEQTKVVVLLEETRETLSGIKDAELGQRGFLITGKDKYLEPYIAGLKNTETHLSTLRSLAHDEPHLSQQLDLINELKQNNFTELSKTITLRKNNRLAEAQRIVSSDTGKQTMDKIRETIKNIFVELRDRQTQVVLNITDYIHKAIISFIVLVVTVSALIILGYRTTSRIFDATIAMNERDITERKRAMDELKKLNEEIKSSNKELEAFSYSVSHDLRAPLRSIAGFVELLKKYGYANADEKSKHYMEVISSSAVQMGRLIDDILTFSRIGRIEMLMTRVSLDHLVQEALKTLQPEIAGREIIWKISPLPKVEGERAMLQLVLVNLISNALKYSRPRATAVIEVGARTDGNENTFYVKDNGVGFDMHYVDKLFGLFQRLHRPEEFEGTGVGLANVQRIIQRHGGRVWAEGKVDEGATFYFSIPKLMEV
ncbi:MAG: CHASE3 domain-containing protein [Gallionella sp.]